MGRAIRLQHCIATAAVLLAAAGPLCAQSTERTVLSGAYTQEQAKRGESVFKDICAGCHTNSEFTGPAFTGMWAGKPVFTFFDQLRNTMPQDNPGGLTREQYAAVIAYVLQLNSMPAGEAELPTEEAELKLILFAPKRDTVAAKQPRR